MEEQFILRVPPSVAERIDRFLSENASSSEDKSLDLSFSGENLLFVWLISLWPNNPLINLSYFSEDGRTGNFVIGNDSFPASLLDLPCVVESFKTYDDSVLIKSADIGQMIMVREPGDAAPDAVEYRHGLTPPMRDARKRRFRREPDLNPELVRRVEEDLLNISAGGTAENIDILPFTCLGFYFYCFLLFLLMVRVSTSDLDVEAAEQEKDGDANAGNASKRPAPTPETKPNVPESGTNAGEPDRSDSDESDDSV
ncbi:hypothetical protein FEM48_Zijuj10G0014000 [Ziziphus jujuba var. spinosa]|uniref:TAFII55 protein conserved region domain-containing protein n=1 Tax=Ziziphus jujuba var. spinosa TaxID=714518 RepID=A0A978UKG7_ZIZJJ|nr:hypothetical protein FEM48_Zijuj10G0014000 [Ziziphus jujuba var. spinosa]